MFASEGTKTACVQVDAAQYSRYDFLMTQKPTEWLINGLMHSFRSVSNFSFFIFNDTVRHLVGSRSPGVVDAVVCGLLCRDPSAALDLHTIRQQVKRKSLEVKQ